MNFFSRLFVFCLIVLGWGTTVRAGYIITTTTSGTVKADSGPGSLSMTSPPSMGASSNLALTVANQKANSGTTTNGDSTFDPTKNQATITITVTNTTTNASGTITLDDMIGGTIIGNSTGLGTFDYLLNETLSLTNQSTIGSVGVMTDNISSVRFTFGDGATFAFGIPTTQHEYDYSSTNLTTVALDPLTVSLISSVPEPSSIVLSAFGLASLVIAARYRRRGEVRSTN